jgi:hypothetical protein
MMISAYNKNYEDALKLISKVVSYFQVSNVFTNDPGQEPAANDLPEGIHKLVVELFTISFEQQNQVWASLSTGYLPSVIYKVRMLVVDTDTRGIEYPAVKQVEVERKKMIT